MKKTKQLQTGNAIRVSWIDSAVTAGWRPPIKEAATLITSIGYFIGEDADSFTMSSSMSNEGMCLTPLSIPKKVISKIERQEGWDK